MVNSVFREDEEVVSFVHFFCAFPEVNKFESVDIYV
jgi:hypothetical protein